MGFRNTKEKFENYFTYRHRGLVGLFLSDFQGIYDIISVSAMMHGNIMVLKTFFRVVCLVTRWTWQI